ncbi:MAG TPA: hypothetical protein VED59_01455 [Acidimicrobiales bacterium]|nr:hypothetical protein [Acidimicrobiales bacterium]
MSILPPLTPTAWANALIGLVIREVAAGAVRMASDTLGQALVSTTGPGLEGGWFPPVVGNMMKVAGFFVAPILFAATLGAILRQDMRRLARAWGACLPLSLLGGFAVAQLAEEGVKVTDDLSEMIESVVSPDLQVNFAKAVTGGLAYTLTWGPVVLIPVLIFLLGALAIWLELALRSAAIQLAVLFMPVALVGLIWPATAHWAKRLVELLGALLLTKPVIVAALCLGSHALAVGDNASSFVVAVAVLLLAAFAPFAILKLIPVVEVSAIAHMQGLSRQPARAVERAVQSVMAKVAQANGAATVGSQSAHGAEGGTAARYFLASMGGSSTNAGEDPLGPAGRPANDASITPAGHD